jgi:hypothetical protein
MDSCEVQVFSVQWPGFTIIVICAAIRSDSAGFSDIVIRINGGRKKVYRGPGAEA